MKIPNWHKILWKEVSKEKSDMMVFWWRWCSSCECAFLECPKCNNNSCNGGSGTVRIENGISYVYSEPRFRELRDKIGENEITEEACDVCWLAKQYENLARLFGEYPKSPEEIAYYNNRILARLGVSLNGELVKHKQG